MVQLIASIVAFAVGILFLPMVFSGMRVRGTSSALQSGAVGGALSVLLGKVLLTVLTLIFFPIALLGPLGAFIIQSLVNIGLLLGISRVTDGVEFDGIKTAVWAGIALTVLQFVVRLVG
ncbi:MAG: hypothetical protein ACE37F_15200 [Nannocystaceae bacterium]|nr:phage holin family protein [bacterium]